MWEWGFGKHPSSALVAEWCRLNTWAETEGLLNKQLSGGPMWLDLQTKESFKHSHRSYTWIFREEGHRWRPCTLQAFQLWGLRKLTYFYVKVLFAFLSDLHGEGVVKKLEIRRKKGFVLVLLLVSIFCFMFCDSAYLRLFLLII